MTIPKKKKTPFSSVTDQEKHNHRDSFKGHRTKKHFLNAIRTEEAEEEITDTCKSNDLRIL